MTNGTEPALEKRVEALLGLEDRMIRHETTNLPLLYNLGARQARGRLLFLTESHCIFEHGPEPRLILTCNPLRPWKLEVPDSRELGLPLFSITFTPLEVAAGDRADPAGALRPLEMARETFSVPQASRPLMHAIT